VQSWEVVAVGFVFFKSGHHGDFVADLRNLREVVLDLDCYEFRVLLLPFFFFCVDASEHLTEAAFADHLREQIVLVEDSIPCIREYIPVTSSWFSFPFFEIALLLSSSMFFFKNLNDSFLNDRFHYLLKGWGGEMRKWVDYLT
jgi:hypothetical protein